MIPSWGGIFPIIERRCSVPRGLTLADDSLSVHWRSDTDAEFFQLSVCADTVEPDFGRLFTTSSTALALPTLHPDSTYHIYLRKQCAFRQDSVWSDWSAPLTIGNGSAAIDDVSISNFQFSVFPNPASSDITVKVSGDQEPVATLLDATGRTVIPPTPFHSSFLIPRSSLSPGVYLLRLHTATGVATKKLIVK